MTGKSPLDLMGAAEIGKLLGVSRQRVQPLVCDDARNTNGFPEPAASLDMGKVWRADEVRAWARSTRPA